MQVWLWSFYRSYKVDVILPFLIGFFVLLHFLFILFFLAIDFKIPVVIQGFLKVLISLFESFLRGAYCNKRLLEFERNLLKDKSMSFLSILIMSKRVWFAFIQFYVFL